MTLDEIRESGAQRLYRRAHALRQQWRRRKRVPCDQWFWCCAIAGHEGDCVHPRDVIKYHRASR